MRLRRNILIIGAVVVAASCVLLTRNTGGNSTKEVTLSVEIIRPYKPLYVMTLERHSSRIRVEVSDSEVDGETVRLDRFFEVSESELMRLKNKVTNLGPFVEPKLAVNDLTDVYICIDEESYFFTYGFAPNKRYDELITYLMSLVDFSENYQ